MPTSFTFIVVRFLKELKGITFGFDGKLARRMLKYAWPILLGLVGILGQVFDEIPRLMPGEEGFVHSASMEPASRLP